MASKVIFLVVALFAVSNAHDFFHNRIVGGDIAPEGFAPFAVSLRSGFIIRTHFCGGSLISETHVLTAAHCIDAVWSGSSLSSGLRVLSGTQIQNTGGVSTTVSYNLTHPEWDATNIKNDIGVFVLSSPLSLNTETQLIPINRDYVDGGVEVTAVGWGLTSYPGLITSNQLKYLVTPSLTHERCVEMRDELSLTVANYPLISLGELCTMHSVGQSVCQGDSGSALFDDAGIVGVVSWGLPCARGAPDVFARVSYYLDWIDAALIA